MNTVEQAIFTSAQTQRSAGYQLLGRSPGVSEDDARALAVWGPSHDSLLALGQQAQSYNFHPLPSGTFCISRTVAAGFEYSGRGGRRVYTQCLIVDPKQLRRFNNNPFALVRAALAGGMLRVYDDVPAELPTLNLVGGASPVDQALLGRLVEQFGGGRMAALVQAAMESACVAVIGNEWTSEAIAGLINCLPPACRDEFTFSTGLKYSSRRPFRVIGLSDDPAEHRWLAHRANVEIVNLLDDPPRSVPVDGWARFVGRALATGRVSVLAGELAKHPWDVELDELPAWGLQLVEDVDASALHDETPYDNDDPDEPDDIPSAADAEPTEARDLDRDAPAADPEPSAVKFHPVRQLAHAAHQLLPTTKPNPARASELLTAPSGTLGDEAPESLTMLERLDDLVYDAVAGKEGATDELRQFWPEVLDELGEELVAESREQYLRYALSTWQDTADGADNAGRAGADNAGRAGADGRDPMQAVHALEVLTVLFDGAL